jgi:hypothetical protein
MYSLTNNAAASRLPKSLGLTMLNGGPARVHLFNPNHNLFPSSQPTTQSSTSTTPRHNFSSRFAVNQYPSPSFPFQITPTCGSRENRPGTGAAAMAPITGCSKKAASRAWPFESLHACRSAKGACDHDVINTVAGSLLPMFRI